METLLSLTFLYESHQKNKSDNYHEQDLTIFLLLLLIIITLINYFILCKEPILI